MADIVKKVAAERAELLDQNKGVTESSRAALSAISGRNVLKTKTEVAKMKRDREIAAGQVQAAIAQNDAAGAVTMAKAQTSAAAQLDRTRRDETLSLINIGIYEDSFAAELGMPATVVKRYADQKAAKINAAKAAKAQAEENARNLIETIQNMKDDPTPSGQNASSLTSSQQDRVKGALDQVGATAEEGVDPASAKDAVVKNAGVMFDPIIPWSNEANAMPYDLSSPFGNFDKIILESALKSDNPTVRENAEKKALARSQAAAKRSEENLKRASAYYEQLMAQNVSEKQGKKAELNHLEKAWIATPAGVLQMARQQVGTAGSLEERASAYAEYLKQVDRTVADVMTTADGAIRTALDKYKNVESIEDEDRTNLELQRQRLIEVRAVLQQELSQEDLSVDVQDAINEIIDSFDEMAEQLDSTIDYAVNYEEYKEYLLYDKYDAIYGHLSIDELEELIKSGGVTAEESKAAFPKASPEGGIYTNNIVGASGMLLKGEKISDEQRKENEEYRRGLTDYYNRRVLNADRSEMDSQANSILDRYATEGTWTQKHYSAMVAIETQIKDYDLYEQFCMSGQGWNGENYYETSDGKRWKLLNVESEEFKQFMKGKEVLLEEQRILTSAYHANSFGNIEAMLTEEEVEERSYHFSSSFSPTAFEYFGGEKNAVDGGDGAYFVGNYKSFYEDVQQFTLGQYGAFDEGEAKTLLALLDKGLEMEAFTYYAAIKEQTNVQKAKSLNGVLAGLMGTVSGVVRYFKDGGYMLANAFNENYAHVAGDMFTASHQVTMERLDALGVGGDGLEMLYMAGYSIADMIPAVVFSLIPYVGGAGSVSYTFSKTLLTTYNDAVLQGKRADEAMTLGFLTGTSEVMMERIIGGIPQLAGKGNLTELIKKGVGKLSVSSGAKKALNYLASMGMEGLEEGMQEVVAPFLAKMAADMSGMTDKEIEDIDWEEAGKSFLIGAIIGGFFDGFEAVSSIRNRDLKIEMARSLMENDGVGDLIGVASKLGNRRARNIMQAYNNNTPIYEGQEGWRAYASLNDVTNMMQSVMRKRASNAIKAFGDRLARYATNDKATDRAFMTTARKIFKKVMYGKTLTTSEAAAIIADERMVEMFNYMLGLDITMLSTQEFVALTRLAAFTENGRISQARVNLFRDQFGELDLDTMERIIRYSDMAAQKVSGVIFQDAQAESALEGDAAEAVDVLKILSDETGIVFYITEQFETGTFLANNMMAIKPDELNRGVFDTIGHRVYFMARQLLAERGIDLKAFLLKEIDDINGAEAREQEIERIRQQFAMNGRDITPEVAEDELCARMMSAIMLNGRSLERLAETDAEAANALRKSLRAVQKHLIAEMKMETDVTTSGQSAPLTKGALKYEGVTPSMLDERQLAATEALGQVLTAMGVNVTFFASEVDAEGRHIGENGSYDPAANTIRLDIYAGTKGENTIAFTAAHELTHFIKKWSKQKYEIFADYLLKSYDKETLDRMIRDKIDRSVDSPLYTRPLTYDEAKEEIVCDSCETFLRDSDLVGRLGEIAKVDKSLFERIKDVLRRLWTQLKELYASLDPETEAGKATLEFTDRLETIRTLWEDAAIEARENAWNADLEEQKNTTVEGGVKKQQKVDVSSWDVEWDPNNSSEIKVQMNQYMDEINDMKPVISISVSPKRGSLLAEQLKDFVNPNFGEKIDVRGFGTILFDKEARSKAIGYANTDGERAALFSTPYVLKQGKAITGHRNHKNKGYPSVTFAAPVELNGVVGNVCVTVLFADKHRVHAVRILTKDGERFELPKKRNAELTNVESTTTGGVQPTINSASINNIAQLNAKSQGNNNKKSIRIDEANLQAEIGGVYGGVLADSEGVASRLEMLIKENRREAIGRGAEAEQGQPNTPPSGNDYEDFPRRAREYVERAERELLTAMGFSRQRPAPARTVELVHTMAMDYFTTGHIQRRGYELVNADEDVQMELAIDRFVEQLRLAERYALDDRGTRRRLTQADTEEDVVAAYEQVTAERRRREQAERRNVLTHGDRELLGQLLAGEIDADEIPGRSANAAGILDVYENSREFERLMTVIRRHRAQHRAELQAEADEFLRHAENFRDKRARAFYARETMERNLYDIADTADHAQALIDRYFDPVHRSEADSTRFKEQYRNRVRALALSQNRRGRNIVSEAYAVQLIGEAESNITYLERTREDLRDGHTLEEWRTMVDELWRNNPDLDRQKIMNAVREFQKIYDELFRSMNDVRIRNGYEPVAYRQGYFPHFQAGETEGLLAAIGHAMGIDASIDALPTTINGMTHRFRPGIQWFSHANERLGFETEYDAVAGFDRYIEGASNIIHQTDNIQSLRALARQIRYRTGDDGLRERIDEVMNDPNLGEAERQALIDEIYTNGRYTLSNFVLELDEYTNLLANKKSRSDREIESFVGRAIYQLGKKIESQIGANMIAANIGSALTNYIALVQGSAEIDNLILLQSIAETVRAARSADGFVSRSTFLTNRRGSDPLVRTWAESASKVAGMPMEVVDHFVSEVLVRARYNQNVARGLSETCAMEEADSWTASVMADRSRGAMPTIFYAKNPLIKLVTQFQVEVNNTLSWMFKDLPRRYRGRGSAALAVVLLKFLLGSWAYNDLYEAAIGRRPAMDLLGILNEAAGDLTGYQVPNLAKAFFDGEKPSFKTEKTGFGAAAQTFGMNVAEQTPFVGGLFGGGRLPISGALPDVTKVMGVLDGETDRARVAEVLWSELSKPIYYLAMPFAGGQLRKTLQGIRTMVRGGSYTHDKDGNRKLQYPVVSENAAETATNWARALIFGKSSLPEAQDWVQNGFDTLSVKETAAYTGLIAEGVTPTDAFELVHGIRNVSESEGKIRALLDANISSDARCAFFYAALATDEEVKTMDELMDEGADMGIVSDVILNFKAAQGNAELKAAVARTYKNVLGSDLVLKLHGKDLYERAQKYEAEGISSDTFFDLYFAGDTNFEAGIKMIKGGLRSNAAVDLALEFGRLIPEEEGGSVKVLQKYVAIADSDLSEAEKVLAMELIGSEADARRITIASEYGVTVAQFVELKELIAEIGSAKNVEIAASIDAIGGLDNTKKAALWQLFTGATSAKNNPYSASVGTVVLEKNNALKS